MNPIDATLRRHIRSLLDYAALTAIIYGVVGVLGVLYFATTISAGIHDPAEVTRSVRFVEYAALGLPVGVIYVHFFLRGDVDESD